MPAADTNTVATLRVPAPLDLPIKRGKMARIPERWTGPLSNAPFEAQIDSDGSLSLGVAFICPKGQRRTGSLWVECADGPELVDRAAAIDAALATALGRKIPDAKGRVGKISLGQLLETLLWVEHGAGGPTDPVQLAQTIPQAAATPVRTSGARSLFADVAKSLKKTLAAEGNSPLEQKQKQRMSASCH